jgi:hypothetical protein
VNVTVSAGNFGSLLRKRLPKFLNSKVWEGTAGPCLFFLTTLQYPSFGSSGL